MSAAVSEGHESENIEIRLGGTSTRFGQFHSGLALKDGLIAVRAEFKEKKRTKAGKSGKKREISARRGVIYKR